MVELTPAVKSGLSSLADVGALAVYAGVAMLPERAWPLCCAAMAAIAPGKPRPWRYEQRVRLTREALPLYRGVQTRLEGQEHIEAALVRQRGVILWVAPGADSDLVTKKALWRASVPVVHLSRPSHGFFHSPLGRKHLNRLQRNIEDRYLRERLMMSDENGPGALRMLLRRLATNEVVSIRVGAASRTREDVVLTGGRVVSIAIGPVRLAYRAGSSLLPVASSRDGQGGFVTRVGPDILAGFQGSDAREAIRAYIASPERLAGWPRA